MVSGISNLDLAETYNYVRDISRQQNEAARSAATGRRVNSLTDDVAAYSRAERLTGQAETRRRYVSELKGLIPQFRNPGDALTQARDALVQAQTLADSNTAATTAQVNQYNALVRQVRDGVDLAISSAFNGALISSMSPPLMPTNANVISGGTSAAVKVVMVRLEAGSTTGIALQINGSGLEISTAATPVGVTGGGATVAVAGQPASGRNTVDLSANSGDRQNLLRGIDNAIARLGGFVSRIESISTILTAQAGTLEGAAEDLVASDPQEANLRLERLRVQREFANGVFGTLNRATAGALRFYS